MKQRTEFTSWRECDTLNGGRSPAMGQSNKRALQHFDHVRLFRTHGRCFYREQSVRRLWDPRYCAGRVPSYAA